MKGLFLDMFIYVIDFFFLEKMDGKLIVYIFFDWCFFMFYLDVDLNEFIYYFSFVFVGGEIFVLVIFILFCVDKW